MATLSDLRMFALALPMTYEEPHFDGPSFRVRNRKFALQWMQTGETILKLPPLRQEELFKGRPEAFTPIRVGTVHWSVVHLSVLKRKELHALTVEAWSTVVPKKVARAYLEDLRIKGRPREE